MLYWWCIRRFSCWFQFPQFWKKKLYHSLYMCHAFSFSSRVIIMCELRYKQTFRGHVSNRYSEHFFSSWVLRLMQIFFSGLFLFDRKYYLGHKMHNFWRNKTNRKYLAGESNQGPLHNHWTSHKLSTESVLTCPLNQTWAISR